MKKVFLLFPILILLVGCPDGNQTEEIVDSIEGNLPPGGNHLTNACSLSRNTSLTNVLNINNSLSSMVADADMACQNSVGMLNGDTSRGTIQTLAGHDLAATDYAQLAKELELEIEYLQANNIDGVYDQQITNLQDRRMNALSGLRSNLTQFDNAQISARRDALRNLGNLYTNYQNVFQACDDADPRAISAMANSGLNLASSLGGLSGGSAMAASLMMQVISAVGNSIETMTEQIQNNLNSARLPTILTCGIEATSKAYCEAKKQYELISYRDSQSRFNGTCSMHEGVQSLLDVSDHIEDLQRIFAGSTPASRFQRTPDFDNAPPPGFGSPSGKPGEALGLSSGIPVRLDDDPERFSFDGPSRVGDNELQRRFLELTEDDNMNAIRSYAESVADYSDAEAGDSQRITYIRNQMEQAVIELNQAISNIDIQLAGGPDSGTLSEFFSNDENNIEKKIEGVAILQENLIKEQLNAELNSDSPNRSQRNTDFNFAVLAGASARIAGADVISDAINTNAEVVAELEGRSTYAALENAIDLGAQNMSSFSDFISNNDIQLGRVIDQVKERNADAQPGDTRYEAAQGVIQTLCGSSLTLYKNEGIPADLKEKCREFDLVPGKTYEELANMRWDDRVCIPIETGVIGE